MIYYGNNDYRDYLAHYGVLGMHWGIRRYQPYSYTEGRDGVRKGKEMGAARKLGDAMKRAGSAVSRTVKNAGSRTSSAIKTFKNNQKAKLTEWKADRAEKKKEKVINSGDVNTVMKHRKHLSNDEIRRATDRIMAEQKLKDLESEEAMKAIERGRRLIANVADVTRNVSSIYNTVTDVKKKMDDASESAHKKLEEKRMNDIIKTGDYEKINRAIERGELSPEKIKTAREIIQNKQLIVEKGQKAREGVEADRKQIEDTYRQAAAEHYKRNVTDVFDRSIEKASRDVKEATTVNKDAKRVGSKIELTLGATSSSDMTDFNKKVKTIRRSTASKKGWETRRKKDSLADRGSSSSSSEGKTAELATKSRGQELFEQYQATLASEASPVMQTKGQEAVSKMMKKKKKGKSA